MVGLMGVIVEKEKLMKKGSPKFCPNFSHLCVVDQSLLLNQVSQLRASWTSRQTSRTGASPSRFLSLRRPLPPSASASASHGSEISTLFRLLPLPLLLSETDPPVEATPTGLCFFLTALSHKALCSILGGGAETVRC